MSKHRTEYRWYKNGGDRANITVFKIFDAFGVENCKIELVEMYPCVSKMELERKEGEYIKNNECVNKMIMGRCVKEYLKEYYEKNRVAIIQRSIDNYNLNKESYLAKKKVWLANNAERISEHKKQYYIDNKDNHKAKMKKWRENNADAIRERDRERYKNNKERIQSRRGEPYICDLCGGHYTVEHKLRHYRSKKHQNALNTVQLEPEEELNPEDSDEKDKTP
jgi:hypothetical protein